MRYLLKILILVILLLGNCFNSKLNALNKIDSLRLVVLNSLDDTNKVLQLKDLSYKYRKINFDTSFKLIQKAISLSQDLEYEFGYAISLNQLGLVYKYKTEYDSAMYYYKKSFQIFDSLGNNREKASILNRMGNIYKRFGKFDSATESFLNSLKLYKELNDSSKVSSVLNNIGVLYNEMRYFDKSLEYQLQSLEIKKALGDWNGMLITIMNIGNNYSDLEEFDKALLYYREALDILGENGNIYDRSKLIHNIAIVYEQQANYSNAKKYYLEAVALETMIPDNEMLILSLQGVGNSLIKEGGFKEGEKYLLKSYNLAQQVRDIRKLHKLAKNLYEVYYANGDYKKGINYLKEFVDLEDTLYNMKEKTLIVELERKYQSEKKEQQIAFLEKEREIQQLELLKKVSEARQKAFQRNILIIVIIIVLGLLSYLYIIDKKRKRANKLLVKQNKKINEQRIEIKQQNKKLKESNSTKDKLFQIIAHDLRSPIVSMESITQLIPYWVEEQDYHSLQRLSKTLEVSVHNVLTLIDNLLNWALSQQGKFPYKPENLDLKQNLKEALDIYIPIAKAKKISLNFKQAKNVSVFADKNMLFTVLRNLLNNAIKFTPELGEITVGFDSNLQFAKVWVKDSGIGIPEEKKEMVFELANGNTAGTKGELGKGLGLFFCKEFVNLNNGDIFIESGYNNGTTITFTLPLFNIAEN